MSWVAVAVGAGALIGGIAGNMKSGPDLGTTDLGAEGYNGSLNSLNAYKNLVGQGPGASDVSAAASNARDYASLLGQTASKGLYDNAAGMRLAEQQYAPQRQALAQSLQDQMAIANRQAASAGRSSNDPIVRARLGAQAMRSTAALSAEQSATGMQLGRQSTIDMLSLRGQQANSLQSLAAQAFTNQGNLFNMSQSALSNETSRALGQAQYEQSRGGGMKGLLTGALSGAGAGMSMASGFGGMGGMSSGGGQQASSGGFSMPQFGGASFNQAPQNISSGSLTSNWSGGFGSAPQYPSMPAVQTFAAVNRPSVNYGTMFGPPAPSRGTSGSW